MKYVLQTYDGTTTSPATTISPSARAITILRVATDGSYETLYYSHWDGQWSQCAKEIHSGPWHPHDPETGFTYKTYNTLDELKADNIVEFL